MLPVVQPGGAAFLDNEPDLAAQVLEWGRHWRRVPRSERRERAQPLVPILEARHTALWAEQARLLLAAHDHLAAAEPRLCRLIATLADGHLVGDTDIAMLRAAPARTRQRLQDDAWGDYPAEHDAAVEAHRAALRRRDRRLTSREHLGDAYNNEHLIICDIGQLIYLKVGPNTPWEQYCPQCAGAILDWVDRNSIVPPLRRLVSPVRSNLTVTIGR